MFETYTEKARRVIFFARYETSQVGSPAIESEHTLFGLLRADRSIFGRYLEDIAAEGELRLQVLSLRPAGNPTSTSLDLPLSEECLRILACSLEEAERLGQVHTGTEHLLLGILREQDCLAAKLLSERGLGLEQAREMVIAAAKQGTRQLTSEPGIAAQAGLFWARVQIVDAETAEPLGALDAPAPIPRIDEILSILTKDGARSVVRVQDVLWATEQEADQPKAILVRIPEQGPAQQAGESSSPPRP